jgi:hypothetical protein
MPDEDEFYEDLTAASAEADGAPYRFALFGEKWEIKHVKAFGRHNAKLLVEGDRGNEVAMIELVLSVGMGGPQLERWNAKEPGLATEALVLEKWLAHCGLSLPKSEGSEGSSETTEKPSTPRSAGSTRARTSGSSSRASSRSGKRSA